MADTEKKDFITLPASDMASWLGFGLSVLGIVAVAKYIPVVKKYV